jgi:serine/threonine protein phosphatase PrpC
MSKFKVTACTAEHIGDRAEQQDRVALITSRRHPNALLAIVADGMGGRSGGRMASDQVISTADHVFHEVAESDAGGLRALLEQIAIEAHTVIRLTALSSEKEPHSTVVALIVRKDYAIWAHAGDSRLYFFRGGRLMHRTADQTYAAHLESEGKAQEAAHAARHMKHVLTSALGVARAPSLVIDEVDKLRVGDAFLLCSDGVWAYFEDQELGSLLHSLSPREASEHIVRIARERAQARGDNISLAIVKLEAPEQPKRMPVATLWFDDDPPKNGSDGAPSVP